MKYSIDHDCELTLRGIEAAEHLSSILDEDRGFARMRRVAKERYGWDELGSGIGRQAFSADDVVAQQAKFGVPGVDSGEEYVSDPDHTVVKVSVPGSGQNSEEVRQWRLISGDEPSDRPWGLLEDLVAPVRDWDGDKFRWLTMPLGDTSGVSISDAREVENAADELGFIANDLHDDNIAIFSGEPRAIDYGHAFRWGGERLEAFRWREFEDFMERIGCRDVLYEPYHRDKSQYTFRHPLDLPGYPYETEDSELLFGRGGRLEEMEVFGSVIPSSHMTEMEVENALDIVLDTEETIRRTRTRVTNVPDGFIPIVKLSAGEGRGPEIGEVESFLEAFYDRFEAAYGEVVGHDLEEPPAEPPDMPDESIIGEIESAFEGL